MNVPILIIIVTLCGFIAVHRLTIWRDKKTRLALACSAFRNSLTSSIADVPSPDSHWDNDVLTALPSIIKNINVAVLQLSPSLSKAKRRKLDNEYQGLKKLIDDEVIPKAVSPAQILYGGGSTTAKDSKEQFHARIKSLLTLAIRGFKFCIRRVGPYFGC